MSFGFAPRTVLCKDPLYHMLEFPPLSNTYLAHCLNFRSQPKNKKETELVAAQLSPYYSPPSSPDLFYQWDEPTHVPRLPPPYSSPPAPRMPGANFSDIAHLVYQTNPSASPAKPTQQRRWIDMCRTRLASLVSDEDFVLADRE